MRFFNQPILNSPYESPSQHWELDEHGIIPGCPMAREGQRSVARDWLVVTWPPGIPAALPSVIPAAPLCHSRNPPLSFPQL